MNSVLNSLAFLQAPYSQIKALLLSSVGRLQPNDFSPKTSRASQADLDGRRRGELEEAPNSRSQRSGIRKFRANSIERSWEILKIVQSR